MKSQRDGLRAGKKHILPVQLRQLQRGYELNRQCQSSNRNDQLRQHQYQLPTNNSPSRQAGVGSRLRIITQAQLILIQIQASAIRYKMISKLSEILWPFAVFALIFSFFRWKYQRKYSIINLRRMKDHSKSSPSASLSHTEFQFLPKCSLRPRNVDPPKNPQATCVMDESSHSRILPNKLKIFECYHVPLVLILSFCTFSLELVLLGFEYSEDKMLAVPFFSFVTGATLLLCVSTIILWKVVQEEKKNTREKQASKSLSPGKTNIAEIEEVIQPDKTLNPPRIQPIYRNPSRSKQSENSYLKNKNQSQKEPTHFKSHLYFQREMLDGRSRTICFFRSWSILAIFQVGFDATTSIYAYGKYEDYLFSLKPTIIIIASIFTLTLLKLLFNLKLCCDQYRQSSTAKVTPAVKNKQGFKCQITKKKLAPILPHFETQENQNKMAGNVHSHITVKKRLIAIATNTQNPPSENNEQNQYRKACKQRAYSPSKEKQQRLGQLKQPRSCRKGGEDEKKKVCINDENNRYYFYETSLDQHSDNATQYKKSVVSSQRYTKRKMFSLLGEAVIEKSIELRLPKQAAKQKIMMISPKQMEDSSHSEGESAINESSA